MKFFSPTLAFALKFIVYFTVLMGAFEASRGSAVERFLVIDCVLTPTTGLIRAIAPAERVTLVDRTITSPGSKLRVTRGCEGIEIFLLLVAAVLAYPCSWKARAQALGAGFVLAYALSVARLVALHFILRYAPAAWEALHGLVLPLAPLIVVTLYFLHWSASLPAPACVPPRPHAS